MRRLLAALLAMLLVPLAARADDTRPPVISDVRAAQRGGQVHIEARITDETGVLMATCHHRSGGGRWLDAPMTKSDYDDTFKVSFDAGPDTEYWIESSDLLGNGPSTYGAAAKPVALGASSPKDAQAQREPPEPPKRRENRPAKVASKAAPPVIEHHKPGASLPVRAQITGPGDEPSVPGKAQVLWRGSDGQEQVTDMQADASGGLGGFKAELPPQAPGAVYYQVVACDPSGSKCAVSTGSKRKWHAVAISPAVGAKAPAIDVPSSKAPRSLPE